MNQRTIWVFCTFLFMLVSLKGQEHVTNSYDLDEVVVTATRMGLPLKSIPQKVEIIDKQKIEAIPVENAAELLKRTTNLDIIQYPGVSAQIGMRGFSPSAHARSYTVIMIDGLPSGTSNLATLPLSVIERIEVVKGPYSVLYGTDAMGGVINIITKKATLKKSGEVTIKGGSFGTTAFDANASGMLSDRLGLVVGFSNKSQSKDYRIGNNNLRKISDVEKIILDEKSYGDVYPNTTYQMSQLFGKLNYALTNRWDISVSSFYNLAADVKTPGNYFTQIASKKDIGRLNVFGEIAHKTRNNKLIISPYYAREKNSNYENANNKDNFISFNDDVREYGVRTNNTHYFNTVSLLTGIDYDVWDYKSKRQSAKGVITKPYKPDNQNQRLSAFAQVNYELENLKLNAGIRANYIKYNIFAHDSLKNEASSQNYSNVIPSIGLKYDFLKGFGFHASVGKAFSIPDAFKVAGSYKIEEYLSKWKSWWRNVYVPNPDLKPETSLSYDAGMSFSSNALSLDMTYFATHHKDKIVKDLTQVGDTTKYINAEKAFMNGLEFLASLDFARMAGYKSKFEIYAGYTFLFDATFTDRKSKTDNTIVTRDLLYVSKSSGNFGISYDSNRGFSTRLHARYKGSRLEEDLMKKSRPGIKESDYYTEGGYEIKDKNDKRILKHPSHLIFDYSAFYSITPQTRIGISVSNLFDENYTEKDGYNMPGRRIMGSFTYWF